MREVEHRVAHEDFVVEVDDIEADDEVRALDLALVNLETSTRRQDLARVASPWADLALTGNTTETREQTGKAEFKLLLVLKQLP